MARQGRFEPAVTDDILDEMVGVLQEKFNMSPELASENRRFIESFARQVQLTRTIHEIAEDPDDDRILGCAIENVSDFIVTYDKDLLRPQRFEGIPIVKVESFLHRGFGQSMQER